MYSIRTSELRRHARYRLRNVLFASIQGDCFARPACIADINQGGVGFLSVCGTREYTGKFIALDLLAEGNRALLRSLPARVVYTCTTDQAGGETQAAPRRYGLQFVNLSALEKRLLGQVIRKYALAE